MIALIAVIAIAAIAVAAFALTSGNDKHEGNSDEPDKPVDDYYPVTVDSMAQNKVFEQTFDKAPERIVCIYSANVELMCLFGLQDKVVKAYTGNNRDYVCVNPSMQAAYDKIAKYSGDMTPELIRADDADLILGWSSTFGDNYLGWVDTWNGYGTKCYSTNRPATTVQDYVDMITDIGKIFNKKDVADRIISEFTAVYSDVSAKVASIGEANKTTALVVEPGYEGSMFVYGSQFLTGDLVTVAGGKNLFDGAMEKLTFEQIASYEPDVIFVMAKGMTEQNKVDALKQLNDVPGLKTFVAQADKVVAYGFYEIYDGGILPSDIVQRMYNDMYGSTSKPDSEYYPVTVSTVMNGGTALQTVTKKPERILVWESSTVELLCYFGLGDRVVGEYTVAEPKRTCILPELQSAYDAVPKLDKSTFSIEQAVSLRPDAILGWESTFTDSYLGSCESWNARGTSCFVTNRPANCVDDYIGILEMIGKIFNMEDLAEEKIKEFTSVYAEVEKKTAGLTDAQKRKVMMILPSSGDKYQLYGSSFLSGDMINVCGGINVYDGWRDWVEPEFIASLQPDLIIIMADNVTKEVAADRFNNNPAFASMTKNRVVYDYLDLYPGGFLPPDILNRLFVEMYGS